VYYLSGAQQRHIAALCPTAKPGKSLAIGQMRPGMKLILLISAE